MCVLVLVAHCYQLRLQSDTEQIWDKDMDCNDPRTHGPTTPHTAHTGIGFAVGQAPNCLCTLEEKKRGDRRMVKLKNIFCAAGHSLNKVSE